MLVLFETAAGYAFFKLLDNNRLEHAENLYQDFLTPENARELISLKNFYRFEDTTEALSATTATAEGKLCKSLKRALKKYCDQQDQIVVADVKLGNAIREKFGINFLSNTAVQDLMRGIRSQLDSLLVGVSKKDMTSMRLGLAHSLSRYKLKFSCDKVDTMVIQAVNLLDELDKELNNYMMRCREWYGWHFPELSKMIQDNMAYVKTVQLVGIRDNIIKCDLSDILSEDIEKQVKEAAEVSMGTEISEEDAIYTQSLCHEIISLAEYRVSLHEYLKSRMMALAPNLSILVGELVGARLMSHAGSLVNLAKHPASTVQILGAEKALFRALKMKKDTPKYGLIYHAQLIGQSSKKNKGKMSRMLAAKASLATRFDALGESTATNYDLGAEHKARLEMRLRQLEERNTRRISGSLKANSKFQKYHSANEYAQYPTSIDSTLQKKNVSKPLIEEIVEEPQQDGEGVDKKKKKKKRSVDVKVEETEESSSLQEEAQAKSTDVSKKKKKKKRSLTEDVEESSGVQVKTEPTDTPKKKKKKRSSMIATEDVGEASVTQEVQEVRTESTDIPKKKKRKHSSIVATEEAGESSTVQEAQVQETEPTNIPKKKKKHSLTSVIEMSSGVQGQEELSSSSKKKKKRDVEYKTEDVAGPSGTQEPQMALDVSIKKKKKKKQAALETEEAVPFATEQMEEQADVSVSAETNEGQKKKKKKKKKEKE